MASNFLIGLVFAIGAGGWIYAKTMRSTGGNTKSSLMAAGVSGFIIMILLVILLNMFMGGE